MKVLLISPNIESLPDPVFPIGLAYITAALKQHNIRYQVLDLCFVEDYDAVIVSALQHFSPDIIGMSLRNVDNVSYPNYISYFPFYRKIVQIIRQHSKARIVIGGSGFALLPESILHYLQADYGILGEGEYTLAKFINTLDQTKDPLTLQPPQMINYPPGIVENLDDLPIPDRTDFDNVAYYQRGGMGNIQTKRGCPFNCIYCTYPVIEGKKIRQRHPKLVCDEIEDLLTYGARHLFFVDNEFNYPIEHAEAICREIIHRKLPIKWSCYAIPQFITSELVELMLEAGCTGLEFGSDAACETMLKNMGKSFTVSDLQSASAICRRVGLSFCHSLLLGGPGETMKTVNETLKTVLEMSPTAVICMLGIRMFPKTKISLIAEDEGIIGPNTDFLKPVFYLSSAIKDEILPFLEAFSKKHPTWIFPGLKININANMQRKLRRFGIKGPLWEYMKTGERFRLSPHI
ncbi:MAG: cobalamin-dependent protein [Desulfobacterales bacterium]|nr:MAG: cobalamin-dependent protein [Desulfobacterales bacterium]